MIQKLINKFKSFKMASNNTVPASVVRRLVEPMSVVREFVVRDELTVALHCQGWDPYNVVAMTHVIGNKLGIGRIPAELHMEHGKGTLVYTFTKPSHTVWFKLNCYDVYQRYKRA